MVSGLSTPLSSDPDTERWRLFDAVVSAVKSLSSPAGLVLVIDDLQWAPPPTLALLGHILRSEGAVQLAILATYRDTEVERTNQLAGMITNFGHLPSTREVTLAGLGAPAMTDFVRGFAAMTSTSRARLSLDGWVHRRAGTPFSLVKCFVTLLKLAGSSVATGAGP